MKTPHLLNNIPRRNVITWKRPSDRLFLILEDVRYLSIACYARLDPDGSAKRLDKGKAEVEACLGYPVLGKRLRDLVQETINSGADVKSLFPSPYFEVHRLKFQACSTLLTLIDRELDLFLKDSRHFQLVPTR